MTWPSQPRLDLEALIEAARKLPPMTPEQRREQRISFAFGNCNIENERVTRMMVEQEHDRIYGKPGK